MSVPLNQQDFERFTALAKAIMEAGKGEISIYTSHDNRNGSTYASIEMKTSHLPVEKLEEIFNCAPLPDTPKPVIRSEYD